MSKALGGLKLMECGRSLPVTKPNEKLMVLVSAETLTDLHLAAYSGIEHEKYPSVSKDILKAQEEARQALVACGWWQQGDKD